MTDKFLPDVADQRALLEQRRDNFRREGYGHFITRIALEVQEGGSPKERETKRAALAELQASEMNCYVAANRLQKELDALPAATAEREG